MTKEAQRGRRWWWKVELKSFSCTWRFVSSLQSARSKCSVLSPCSFSNNKDAAAAVLFYGTIQLLFQALPANNIKCACLSSCAQWEVLLAGEEGGGTKLSTNTLHAAMQLVSLELLWLGLKKKGDDSVGARNWNNGLVCDTQPLTCICFINGVLSGHIVTWAASPAAQKPHRPGCRFVQRYIWLV